MYFKNALYIFATTCLTLVTMNVEAIPAFARKTNMACSTCHTAWPALNAFGRQYKEHGYRLGHLEAPTKTISENLKWDESLPVSVILVARPYDKKGSASDPKIRALHEVELMVAGPMGEKMSGFFEIEAEDEVENGIGFDTGIPLAQLTYNHSEAANLQFSWGSHTLFDPYDNYSGNRRMTRGTNSVIDNSFGGADNGGALKSSRQNISLYGRPAPKFFYGVALSGDAGDAEGEGGDTLTARIAFDVLPSLTIGAMHISGTANATSTAGYWYIVDTTTNAFEPATSTPERDYSRTGFDLQAEVAGFTFNAAFISATDDNVTATAEIDNDAFYVQAMYVVKEGARVTWAPLLRFDSYDRSGGTETVDEITTGINYYFTENVRGMFEFWDRDSTNNSRDDDRVTVQLFAAF